MYCKRISTVVILTYYDICYCCARYVMEKRFITVLTGAPAADLRERGKN